MRLFNASSMFNEDAVREVLTIIDKPDEVKRRAIAAKKALLESYNLRAYNLPDDFTSSSYVLATNHLTDSDAPLIMSFYYETMRETTDGYPVIFVFAKENCFNGVSIPKELMPILELERVYPVERGKIGGAKEAMKAARKWFAEGEKPKHFLIFSQGTIYDINNDKAEDIESGAFWLARLLGIRVLPAFIEQAVEGADNRLIFAEPMVVPKDCRDFYEYQKLWLERVIGAQNDLEKITGVKARAVSLDKEHQTRKKFSETE